MSKVALVIKNAYSYAGTENVCNFMSECLSEQNDVVVYSLEGEGKPFYPYPGVNDIISFGSEGKPLRAIIKKIREEKIDTVFLISMGRLSVMYALYSFFSFGRKTAKIYACEHIAINSFSKCVKLIKFLTLHYYDNVIVLTERDRDIYARKGIASLYIPNPIKYKNFVRTKRTRQALAVGRLDYQKGFDLLLDIWREFIIKHPDWKLVIAGDGELRDKLIIQAQQAGIDKQVDFVGRVTNIDDFYQSSDMLLMTSRYEGLPLVLLEAKSWALPAIAYDCPTGPREIIENEQDGYLVAMNNKRLFIEKMEKLAKDDELLFSMSEISKRTSLKFDCDSIKVQWNNLTKY